MLSWIGGPHGETSGDSEYEQRQLTAHKLLMKTLSQQSLSQVGLGGIDVLSCSRGWRSLVKEAKSTTKATIPHQSVSQSISEFIHVNMIFIKVMYEHEHTRPMI